jgi:hypothetical protein
MGSAAVRGLVKRRSERDRVLLAPSGGPTKARAPRLPVAAAICSPSNIPQRRATFASANWAAPGPAMSRTGSQVRPYGEGAAQAND